LKNKCQNYCGIRQEQNERGEEKKDKKTQKRETETKKTKKLYHRERILETSTLSCNEEEEEITKPPKR
jgi:hypothetical protein